MHLRNISIVKCTWMNLYVDELWLLRSSIVVLRTRFLTKVNQLTQQDIYLYIYCLTCVERGYGPEYIKSYIYSEIIHK